MITWPFASAQRMQVNLTVTQTGSGMVDRSTPYSGLVAETTSEMLVDFTGLLLTFLTCWLTPVLAIVYC